LPVSRLSGPLKMPWPVEYAQRCGCVYQMCSTEGHSVCRTFGAYYERLCEAAQAVLDDPKDETFANLSDILNEEVRLERHG
jgi:hypothetical protein